MKAVSAMLAPAMVGCTGKVAFGSYSLAMVVVNRKQPDLRKGRSAYHCGHCGLWHVGTENGTTKQRARDMREKKNHD